MKSPLAVVLHGARLAVHDLARNVDDAAVRGVHALQAHADAEDGDLARVRLDRGDGNAAVAQRVARARRDDEVCQVRGLGLELDRKSVV